MYNLRMEILYCSIGLLLVLLGIVGCVFPVLPGPILAYCGLFCMIPTQKCPSVTVFVILAVLTLIVTIADSVIPAIGAKKFNCSKQGTWGCLIGTIAGIFFMPIGIIAGPFLGAFIGELIAGKNAYTAMKGGFGALLGFLAGTFLKFAVCIAVGGVIVFGMLN